MSEMVERVALAIGAGFSSENKKVDPATLIVLFEPATLIVLFEPAARAAVAAMREPTFAMIDANKSVELGATRVRNDWNDMIDEALK